jgi:hypothetical protein
MRRYARYSVVAVRHNADSASPFVTMSPNRFLYFQLRPSQERVAAAGLSAAATVTAWTVINSSGDPVRKGRERGTQFNATAAAALTGEPSIATDGAPSGPTGTSPTSVVRYSCRSKSRSKISVGAR